jgi:hypothetical protein
LIALPDINVLLALAWRLIARPLSICSAVSSPIRIISIQTSHQRSRQPDPTNWCRESWATGKCPTPHCYIWRDLAD